AAERRLPCDAARGRAVALFDRLNASFRAAALDFDARRYRLEANYNSKAGLLYEVRVRRSNLDSDRHRQRSELFFYGMLIAQVGVAVGTFAMSRRSALLWLLALAAGLASLGFSAYVYLTI